MKQGSNSTVFWRFVGFITLIVGIVISLPLIVFVFYPDEVHLAKFFYLPALCYFALGVLLIILTNRPDSGRFRPNQEAAILVGAWLFAILLSTAPYILSGSFNFTQALFEVTSGYTTTGLTLFESLDAAPRCFLFYRAMNIFIGGVGFLLVLSSVLNLRHAVSIYGAEGHKERLIPNIFKTAKLILGIYLVFIIIFTLAYFALGMRIFDSLIHSISSIATGGFSTYDDNIQYFNTPAIEWVTILAMFLGSISFTLHFAFFRGKWKTFFGHAETKFTFLVITAATVLLLIIPNSLNALPFLTQVRQALFNVVSAISTSGYVAGTEGYSASAAMLLFLMLMIIGGQVGSTSSGIKQYRVVLIAKSLWWSLRDMFGNRRVVRVNKMTNYGEREAIDKNDSLNCAMYITLFFAILILGAFVFMCYGHNLRDSIFDFTSLLTNSGYSYGIINPSAPSGILWTSIVGMIFGRLEIFVILLAIGSVIYGVKAGRRG